MPEFTIEQLKEYIEQLRLIAEEGIKPLVESLTGRKDVRSRVAVMANPDNLETMSVLSHAQAEFVGYAHWVAGRPQYGGMWSGLGDYADRMSATSISVGGRGRDDSIRFVGALSETKLLSKIGVNLKDGEGKE